MGRGAAIQVGIQRPAVPPTQPWDAPQAPGRGPGRVVTLSVSREVREDDVMTIQDELQSEINTAVRECEERIQHAVGRAEARLRRAIFGAEQAP